MNFVITDVMITGLDAQHPIGRGSSICFHALFSFWGDEPFDPPFSQIDLY